MALASEGEGSAQLGGNRLNQLIDALTIDGDDAGEQIQALLTAGPVIGREGSPRGGNRFVHIGRATRCYCRYGFFRGRVDYADETLLARRDPLTIDIELMVM
jgi:hypothetical protein